MVHVRPSPSLRASDDPPARETIRARTATKMPPRPRNEIRFRRSNSRRVRSRATGLRPQCPLRG